MRKIAFLGLLCTLLAASVYGQATSNVTGRVTDSSGAVIGDAEITLTDTSTNIPIVTHSNASGLYILNNVAPGHYDLSVSKSGFNKSQVRAQDVVTGSNLTLNVTLEVGAITQTVEVTSVAGAELQTLNATMGSSLGGEEILNLPTINRDVSALVFLQPTVAPTFGGAEGNVTSGQVAGAMSDQNTYLLDGGNNTSDFDGDNGTYVGSRSGAVPTPVESVEEFRVNTNNMTADFAGSQGGQVIITTKRGTNQFHGAAYDFFQSDVLSSNAWFNNFDGIAKPKSHYNRFGGALGGPISNKEILGGKTYFFSNYEGERYPRSGPLIRTVPSDTLRAGIIQERDANGNIVQYNLATSTACGSGGGLPCDPRGVGISPTVNQIWNKFEPHCNYFVGQDPAGNTCGYLSNLSYPLSTNFGVFRLDHDFGAKWRFNASYHYFGKDNPTTNQTDIGGLLPGDKLGQAAAASAFPVSPRYLTAGITGTLSPNLTNEFNFNYTRNQWQYLRAGATPQLPGLNGAVGIGGESTNALIPVNIDTQNARNRLWAGHDYDFRDSITWLKGTHLFQMGGEILYEKWTFDRYDNVVGGLTQLVYDVSSSGVNFTPAFEPNPCSATVTSNCLPSTAIGSWKGLYSELAGIVDNTTIVVSRTGNSLQANPIGTPLHSVQSDPSYSAFFSDSWKVKPNLTLSYGLNYALQMPPTDKNGAEDVLTDASGNVVTINNYLSNVKRAAVQGQVYNPTLGFTPVNNLGKYPYHPFYGGFSPRVAVAWNPQVTGDGWLAKILGDKNTVIRAGFARQFSRSLAAGLVSTSVLGDGFLQPVGCSHPTSAGACTAPGQVDPATAFRIGVDGNNAPVGAITPTLQTPVTPGVNAPYATLVESLDSNWRPSASNQVDFSIQRQFKGNIIAEVGYVGVWTNNLYQGIDFGNVPSMTTLNGQSFAQAYGNLAQAAIKGQTVGPQPFFEAALKGSPYCNGFANCTAAVASNEAGNIATQSVTSLWSDLDTSWTAFGPALTSTTQCFYCYAYTSDGYSNYQAMVATFQKRYARGLTMQANFTFSHALGILSTGQSYTLDNAGNPFNLYSDYGPAFFDRKFTLNVLASYQLPFGKGHRWGGDNAVVKRIVGGWSVSPIFTYGTGLPLSIITGSYQEQGQAWDGDLSATAIPISGRASSYGNSLHYNTNNTGQIGVNGNSANGGTGINYFSDPAAVYNNFRPFILGTDQRTGGAGILRGQPRYNLDLGLTKDTRITERIGAQLYVQAFNVLNHTLFNDPGLNLQDPNNFGTITGQYNTLTLGGSDASKNYTRIIQIGLRISF